MTTGDAAPGLRCLVMQHLTETSYLLLCCAVQGVIFISIYR